MKKIILLLLAMSLFSIGLASEAETALPILQSDIIMNTKSDGIEVSVPVEDGVMTFVLPQTMQLTSVDDGNYFDCTDSETAITFRFFTLLDSKKDQQLILSKIRDPKNMALCLKITSS